MAKKQLAVEVLAALREIAGKSPKTNHSKTGQSVATSEVRPAKVKKPTEKTKKLFNTLAKQREDAMAKIKEATEERTKVNARLTELVTTYGRAQIDKDKLKDKILFANPYKGELAWSTDGGAIDTEAVAKEYPELIEPAVETINMSHLSALLKVYEVPQETLDLVKKFRDTLAALEKSQGIQVVERKDDRLLDIEKYAQYKDEGKITAKQVAKFESVDGHYSLRINKLTDRGPRCSGCGNPRPKRMVSGQKHTCTRCGQTE